MRVKEQKFMSMKLKYFDTESDVGYKITNKSGDNNHLK